MIKTPKAESSGGEAAGRASQLGGAIERIAAQAAAQPGAMAVASPSGAITFAELEAASNRLARELRARGVELETAAGLFTDRSPAFVIGALAILKAGGAYVPLDPAGPPQRLAGILRDSGAPVLVSHAWKAASLPSGPWATLDMDIERGAIDARPSEPPAYRHSGESLAYVVYTSGATGAPKGVEVTHGNLAHLMEWHRREYAVTPRDRASQLAGLGFDAAVWEIWCNLGAGATVVMIDDESRISAEALRDWLVREQITISFAPTLMAENLLDAEWPKNTALRKLLTGADTLRRYPGRGLPFDLINHYGPTECTVLVACGLVPAGEQRAEPPTIGRPIEGIEIHIVDENLDAAAPGEPGELCVAGPQVARGYRGLPQATAEKFAAWGGGRIYRTGDRARFLPNGELAFLGRLDRQIKIRGYRIEPDEVAAQLNRHPAIRQCAVAAPADVSGEPALTAYVTLAPGAQPAAAELRRFLAPSLAAYMVPSHFVRVNALPVNANGKCDYDALPASSAENLLPETEEQRAGSGGPETVSARLTALVCSLTGLREVQPDDNFFLIGGHSLLAAQLVAKVQDQFGVRLSLRQMFEAPTINALAAAISVRAAGAGQ
jgi:amino acid adenylation domain-containing protein